MFEGDVLALHLAPDRVRRFLTAGDDGVRHPALFQLAVQLGEDARHDPGPLVAQEIAPGENAGARVGEQLGKREILELIFHALHAKPLG